MSGEVAPKGTHGAEPLAIVGMACLFPRAGSLAEYWSNIRRGVDAIGDIPLDRWRPDDYYDPDAGRPDMTYARRGGFLEPVDFDPLEFGISPNNIEATDTTQLLAMLAARDALRDAGYAPLPGAEGRDFDRARTGVVLGVTGALELVIPLGARLGHPIWRRALAGAGVDPDTAEDVVRRIAHAYVPWQENSFPGLLGNVAAGRIASRFDLGGTNCVVDAACASSLGALHLAALELRTGRADMVVTGGVDTFNDIFMYMCFSKTPALSASGTSRPFSDDGDGTILGEGAGVVVLKRLADAREAGDRVYALVRGIGSGSDGRGSAIYAPQSRGQARAMRAAYADAGIAPSTVGLVEGHGTGTRVGDATEIESLHGVLGACDADGPWCALGSVKSMIGHTKAAAGVAGLIKASLALHRKVLPPTLHVAKPHPGLAGETAPVYPNTEARPWLPTGDFPRRAAVSAFGFGGSNFHCVLEEAGDAPPDIEWDGRVEILAFHGDSPPALRAALDAVPIDASWPRLRALAAAQRHSFVPGATHRLVMVIERDGNALATRMRTARDLVDRSAPNGGATPDGTWYASGPPRGALAMLFPGQGAQYCNMLRDLANVFPPFHEALVLADVSHGETKPGRRLSDRIYPRPAFDDATRANDEARLRDTTVAQPAIGAISAGASAVLAHFGVTPDVTGGHSFGELTALAQAGRLAPRDFHALAAARGRTMGSLDGDRGAMLAVSAPLDDVQATIGAERLDVVVANRNAPEQAVLSGPTDAIEGAARAFESRGVRCRRLPVAAAFHSPLVAEASAPFAAGLRDVPIHPGRCAVHANGSGQRYPDDPAGVRRLLGGQLARPVDFIAQIESMHAAGARTFVEVGPGRTLSGLVAAILAGREHRCVTLDASGGRGDGIRDLARALAQIAAAGHPVRLERWDPTPPRPADGSRGLTVALTGANAVRPRPPIPPAARKAREPAPAPATSPEPIRSAAPAVPAPPTATPAASPLPVEEDAMHETRALLAAIERMQARTADLHRQYLEGQAKAQETMRALIEARFASTARAVPPDAATVDREALAATNHAVLGESPIPVRADDERGPGVARAVIDVVADRTGYPADMLGLDMSLDADLGIDSIKRVEILSALQDRLPGAPAIGPEELGTIRTLRDVVARLAVAGAARAVASVTPAPAPASSAEGPLEIERAVIDVVADRTGYPADMLGLDMSLDADLGIDSIKRVEILSALQDRLLDAPAIGPEELGTIRTLRDVVARLTVTGTPPAVASVTPAPAPASSAEGPLEIERAVIAVVADRTGYPADMLGLDMSLDADLGIDSIKRVEILSALQDRLPDAPAIGPEELGTIRTLRDVVARLSAASAPVAAPAAPAERATAPAEGPAEAERAVIDVVAAKTGYPADMLGLDMSLDADLGIDSIKRVEILSALQDRLPGTSAVAPEELGTFHTLGDIVARLASTTGRVVERLASVAERVVDRLASAVERVVVEIVADKTGYPSDMLGLDMSLDADLGIDSIKRVEILSALQDRLPGAPTIAPEELGSLRTLRDVVERLSSGRMNAPEDLDPATAALDRAVPEPVPMSEARERADPPRGPVLVTRDDDGLAEAIAGGLVAAGIAARTVTLDDATRAAAVSGLVLVSPREADGELALAAFRAVRRLGPSLREAGGLLAAVCRLDGRLGFGGGPVAAPASGALAGIVKTAACEWPEVRARVIDAGGDVASPKALARAVVDELGFAGPIEVGLTADGPVSVRLRDAPLRDAPAPALAAGELVVISGGARGVTAAAAAALARTCQPAFLLLGRSPAPGPEPEGLDGLEDEAAIKRALAARPDIAAGGPRSIEAAWRRLVAAREMRATLETLRRSGSEVTYAQVDVCDRGAVRRAVDAARTRFGPVRGLVHGAGVIEDRLIADKSDAQFRRVFDTKVRGFESLIAACDDTPPRFVSVFSSSTARFGRRGQVDYAAANETLNKLASTQAHAWPACRVVSVNWGPWEGGMVTPALGAVFATEGIGLVPLRSGAEQHLMEIGLAPGHAVEVVIIARPDARNAAPTGERAAHTAP